MKKGQSIPTPRRDRVIKVVVAPDKFKGSLSASEVSEAIKSGIHTYHGDIDVETVPMADGGEGSLSLLRQGNRGKLVNVTVFDPLFRKITSNYLFDPDTQTAYIEMSRASGLILLTPNERDALKTSSYGTGQLIAHALRCHPRRVYLFLGGSATNDAGIGIAGALGYRFIDKEGHPLAPQSLVGRNLIQVRDILPPDNLSPIKKTDFRVVNDVMSPLYGKKGAAYVYAPQKGADPEAVRLLDRGLRHIGGFFGKISDQPGSGAAGGIGAGALYFLKARKESGINFFIRETGLSKKLRGAHLAVSGEGRLDRQSSEGKVISGIADLLRRRKKKIPFVVIVGKNDATSKQVRSLGIDKVYSLIMRDKDRAFKETSSLIAEIAEEMMREFCSQKISHH